MTETDLQLLSQLYAIHSPTGGEWRLICFIREYVATHIPEAKVSMDRMGNLYIEKSLPYGGGGWRGLATQPLSVIWTKYRRCIAMTLR